MVVANFFSAQSRFAVQLEWRCRHSSRIGGAESPAPGTCTSHRGEWITSCFTPFSNDYERPVDAEQQRVERPRSGLERVQTPEAAKAVIARVERLSRGKTEAQTGQRAEHPAADSETDQERAAAATIERAAERPTAESAIAATLATTAAETVAPTPPHRRWSRPRRPR
jgi:hypothetical protein